MTTNVKSSRRTRRRVVAVFSVVAIGLLLGFTADWVSYAQEIIPDPYPHEELASDLCKPSSCYNMKVNVTHVDVKILKTDGHCTDEQIKDRIAGNIAKLGDNKPHEQKCKSPCTCHTTVQVNPAGDTQKFLMTDIDVANPLWPQKCLVTVEVTITYAAGGTGSLGECIKQSSSLENV